MKMKTLAAMALAGVMSAAPAMADLVIPDLSYRTGPYAAGGTPFSDGYQDYFNLLNARDGGIGGGGVRKVGREKRGKKLGPETRGGIKTGGGGFPRATV